jgi:uncharacterized membrane protein YsdA (DUF1294 family)
VREVSIRDESLREFPLALLPRVAQYAPDTILAMTRNPSATERARFRRQEQISLAAACVLGGALVLPGAALSKLSAYLDVRVLLGYAATISAGTYLMYLRDKRKAAAGEWRISEATLHVAELLGGWPGAFLAQRLLRHKIVKRAYQVVFWAIVLVHQYAALDYVSDWAVSRLVIHSLMEKVMRGAS